jgi:hypothetical protein
MSLGGQQPRAAEAARERWPLQRPGGALEAPRGVVTTLTRAQAAPEFRRHHTELPTVPEERVRGPGSACEPPRRSRHRKNGGIKA